MRKHLIVVLPGIGGSVLAPKGRPDEPVWSVGWPDRRLLRHPEMLALDQELEPVGLISSLRPVPFWTAITGYERVVAALSDGRNPDPTVLAAPYDFRRGIVPAAQRLDDLVRQRLETLWPGADHRRRVIVVAHSMGGLVARYWIGPGGAAGLCRSLITLGTPHWGAPKALSVMAHGLRIGGVSVLPGLRDVLRTWPGLAQLLPRYRAVGHAGGLWYPHEVPLPWREWGADPRAAYDLHREIEAAWENLPRSGTTMVPRIGFGHGTLRDCRWDGAELTVSPAPPAWPELGRWDDERGDGTVPAFSGLPVEMRQPPEDFLIRRRHGQLGALREVSALVARLEGRGDLWAYKGDRRPAVLGLDLEELHAAGTPIPVAASIRGSQVRTDAGPVWASVLDVRGRPIGVDARLEYDGEHRGVLPGLTPGVYRLQATVRGVPGAGDLTTEQTIEVFDDADL
ncbi:hypothetical protein [Actinoplanes sp. NPDC049802]|uniref:lipase/acyltransferase domain-containing protein n=1 Tax=Actinoplanes sp. NPDC049802 TaxID=3154742 RepID=UPI0033F435A8